jgi:hypothetical protein
MLLRISQAAKEKAEWEQQLAGLTSLRSELEGRIAGLDHELAEVGILPKRPVPPPRMVLKRRAVLEALPSPYSDSGGRQGPLMND